MELLLLLPPNSGHDVELRRFRAPAGLVSKKKKKKKKERKKERKEKKRFLFIYLFIYLLSEWHHLAKLYQSNFENEMN